MGVIGLAAYLRGARDATGYLTVAGDRGPAVGSRADDARMRGSGTMMP